jgi:hypothetical protein
VCPQVRGPSPSCRIRWGPLPGPLGGNSMPRFFLSRQPARFAWSGNRWTETLSVDHTRGSPFHHPTTGRQRHERVDLFAFRDNAALKQQELLIHHQLSNPIARWSDARIPCCTCPHQHSRMLENTRTICFETGMFGRQQASGGNDLHLSWRKPQKSSPGPRDDEVLFPQHCCSMESHRRLGSRKRNFCIARIASDTWR